MQIVINISVFLFFEILDFEKNTIFPIGYLSLWESPPAIITGQIPISIQYNSNNLVNIGNSTKGKLEPFLFKTVKQLIFQSTITEEPEQGVFK